MNGLLLILLGGDIDWQTAGHSKEHTMELRFLMSAANPSATFDLRCEIREKLIDYLQKHYPHALPRVHTALDFKNMP